MCRLQYHTCPQCLHQHTPRHVPCAHHPLVRTLKLSAACRRPWKHTPGVDAPRARRIAAVYQLCSRCGREGDVGGGNDVVATTAGVITTTTITDAAAAAATATAYLHPLPGLPNASPAAGVLAEELKRVRSLLEELRDAKVVEKMGLEVASERMQGDGMRRRRNTVAEPLSTRRKKRREKGGDGDGGVVMGGLRRTHSHAQGRARDGHGYGEDEESLRMARAQILRRPQVGGSGRDILVDKHHRPSTDTNTLPPKPQSQRRPRPIISLPGRFSPSSQRHPYVFDQVEHDHVDDSNTLYAYRHGAPLHRAPSRSPTSRFASSMTTRWDDAEGDLESFWSCSEEEWHTDVASSWTRDGH